MATRSTPPVSVLMPVYNAERYLGLAIESVLIQSFGEFEFIIVDDGSTDRSRQVVEHYARHDGRIQFISRPNTGIVGALNDGLAICRGEFIARMDADDVSMPDRFARQVRYLRQNPDCVLLGSRVLLIDKDGDPIVEWVHEFEHEEIDRAHLNYGWPVVHPTVMIRSQAVRQVGGYRPQYAFLEDLDLFLRLAEAGRLANLRQPLLQYRKHPASICHTRQDEQRQIRSRLYAETYQRRGLGDVRQPENPGPLDGGVRAEQVMWAWWALGAGHIATARKYAKKVLRGRPLNPESWKIMYCALRGH